MGASWGLLGPSWRALGGLWGLLGGSWGPLGSLGGHLSPSWGRLGGLLGPLGALLAASWGPLGGLLGALKKDVGADGAVFNMISRANKKVSETVAPRGPFFQGVKAILYCNLQYIFDIGLIGPKSDF